MKRPARILAGFILLSVGTADGAPRRADPAMESLRAYLRADLFDPHDAGPDTRAATALVDLDGDGRREAIVYVSGSTMCGSGGCHLLILTRAGASWREVARTAITWPPIRVLSARTRGWRDIGVFVAGGGILPGYEAVLKFDGRRYPPNPSMVPRRRGPPPPGRTVIGRDGPGAPVYGR
jgi:hypothetical protein